MIGRVCMSTASCQYKSEITGYCGYTENGCVNEHVQSVWINEPSYKIAQQVDVSDESIEKIADAIVNILRQM